MKSCIPIVLVFMFTSAFTSAFTWKCKRNTPCIPSVKCQTVAEDGGNTRQVCGNDGKSYALSCIACAQNCNKKTFKWKDGVCGILGQEALSNSPTELFGGHLDKPKHSGQPGRDDGLDKPGNTFKPGHRDESYQPPNRGQLEKEEGSDKPGNTGKPGQRG